MMPIVVVAAVIERDDRFLLTLRPKGSHLAEHWEFPGGKCQPHETHVEALRRELFEELDVVVTPGRCVYNTSHDYGDRTIELHFFACEFEGEAKPMLGQEMRWVERGQLASLRLPEADAGLVALL